MRNLSAVLTLLVLGVSLFGWSQATPIKTSQLKSKTSFMFSAKLYIEKLPDNSYKAKIDETVDGYGTSEILADFRKACQHKYQDQKRCSSILFQIRKESKSLLARVSTAVQILKEYRDIPKPFLTK